MGKFYVSIHAPVWGATISRAAESTPTKFQSTHPCGVRPTATHRDLTNCGFNPRTRVGCDWARLGHQHHFLSFNPRTRVGCDMTKNILKAFHRLFQSTHPCGVRQTANRYGQSNHGSFNPRTRVGCDPRIDVIYEVKEFQSTHPCGVRRI